MRGASHMMAPYDIRIGLRGAGFTPVPCVGKAPPMRKWQQIEATTTEIQRWDRAYPKATNTGVLTKFTPTIDIDITNPEAAADVEALIRERLDERGAILVRFGRSPKRAIPLRTTAPFKKIAVVLTAPDGSEAKIELLGDGQQVVVDGVHPDTGKPYAWHGAELGRIKHADLPEITEDEGRALVDAAALMLVERHGYTKAKERPKANGKGNADGAADWSHLTNNILDGHQLHDSLRDLAAKLVASGMSKGATVNYLRGLMDASMAPHDDRWKARRDEIPRLVDGLGDKSTEKTLDNLTPCTIDDTLDVFKRWLVLESLTPVYAVLGTIAANLLPGDPVWLGLIGPPSSAKTEILNSTSMLPNVAHAATVTPAGLLSGTPKRQRDKTAKGGLLAQIGDFGIIVLKDFGSVLSMRPDAKAETLAALREVYDGAWTRHLGTDGGKTLHWHGKLGLVFGSTPVIDAHHSVIGNMGDRFLLNRFAPEEGQFGQALKHKGASTARMRKELAEAVARLFAGWRPEHREISADEIERIDRTITLVVRLRGAIQRDHHSREIEYVFGAEGTARIGLTLERLLAGLDTLGVDRAIALDVVDTVALDSVPPTRRKAYEHLLALAPAYATTKAVAQELELPTTTTRRALEDLCAYGLVKREPQGQGQPDLWQEAFQS